MKSFLGSKNGLRLILAAACAWGIWAWNSPDRPELATADAGSQAVAQKEESLSKQDRGLAASKAPEAATLPSARASSSFQQSAQAKAALEEFADLSEKVFLSSGEQKRRSELLMNSENVRNIGDYLLTVPSVQVQDQIYDQSLEFLVEALKQGSNEALTQVQRVISDPQVENSELPMAQRKFLAETKGVLLYQYAALNSLESANQSEQQIAGLIPGPVTQKIWNQVLQVLDANFVESKQELAETR